MKSVPYIIAEVANVHSGRRKDLDGLVQAFGRIDHAPKGIKFQPLQPDKIALPDFHAFKIYEELYFDAMAWREVIAAAALLGDVWLDLFDTYGVEVLSSNLAKVAGIKLQASVLDNDEVVAALMAVDLSAVKLMVNVSGHDLAAIGQHLANLSRLRARETILQVGFQAYPTSIADTALQKVPVLRAAFPGFPICIADHADATQEVARHVPAWAVVLGCEYVEKHFCLRRADAKYDAYSALEPEEFTRMVEGIRLAADASRGSFIPDAESAYLRKSYQAPVSRLPLRAGALVALSDLLFRRTGQAGLTLSQVRQEQEGRGILAADVPAHSTLARGAFRHARIAAIVACRMKSSRLQQKATLPIEGVPSVERCLENCFLMPGIDDVILATSVLEEDALLEKFTLGGRAKFWKGDPLDVINRYLGACERFGIDVVVRVTADCPVISPEIAGILLESHFQTGADYSAPKSCAVGTGPEIYNVQALRRVIELLGKAEYSEYMTWYMRNNPDVFKVNLVELPPGLVRDYRMTLDYPEDLAMFERLYRELGQQKLVPTLKNAFAVLDRDPSIPALNQHLTLTYRTDEKLIQKLNEATRIRLPR